MSALELLEAESGPVLADFPQDAPSVSQEAAPLACPMDFSPKLAEMTDAEQLFAIFEREVAQLQSWFDLAVKKRKRTTFGGTFGSPQKTAALIVDAASGKLPDTGAWQGALATALRMAVADLKAYYHEAISAQPGQPTDSQSLDNWFWGKTGAARVIHALQCLSLASSDGEMRLLGKLLLVPRAQTHRFKT